MSQFFAARDELLQSGAPVLQRLHDGRREVIIYDCVDPRVPMSARMAARRSAGIGLHSGSEYKIELFARH